MANVKISNMPLVDELKPTAYIPIVQDGKNYAATAEMIAGGVDVQELKEDISYLEDTKQDVINAENKLDISYIDGTIEVATMTKADIEEVCPL